MHPHFAESSINFAGKKHKRILRSNWGFRERGTMSNFLSNSYTCLRTVKHLPVLRRTEVLAGVNDTSQNYDLWCPSSLP